MRGNLFILLAVVTEVAHAQSTLRVSSTAWGGLNPDEREFIQQRHVVEARAGETFGTIIDNQAADRSTSGTTFGANLGQAVGNAAYVDKALSGGDYSAKSHLGAMLLGGLLGSTLDTRPRTQYQFRYAVRLGNGNVIYQDAYSADPFRHAVGVCVSMPDLTLLPDQHICTQTTDSLRNAHFSTVRAVSTVSSQPSPQRDFNASPPATASDEIVSCKVGALAPVQTTTEKCKIINGAIIK